MKIALKKIEEIKSALAEKNGKASAHTATIANLIDAVKYAESQLESFGISKKDRTGVRLSTRSGGSVSRSYKYCRKVSDCSLIRGSSDWYLTSVTTTEIFPNQSGFSRLELTPEQDAIAVAKLRQNYNINSNK